MCTLCIVSIPNSHCIIPVPPHQLSRHRPFSEPRRTILLFRYFVLCVHFSIVLPFRFYRVYFIFLFFLPPLHAGYISLPHLTRFVAFIHAICVFVPFPIRDPLLFSPPSPPPFHAFSFPLFCSPGLFLPDVCLFSSLCTLLTFATRLLHLLLYPACCHPRPLPLSNYFGLLPPGFGLSRFFPFATHRFLASHPPQTNPAPPSFRDRFDLLSTFQCLPLSRFNILVIAPLVAPPTFHFHLVGLCTLIRLAREGGSFPQSPSLCRSPPLSTRWPSVCCHHCVSSLLPVKTGNG